MLYWTMLAACTVGPGTVVTCARSGVEFQMNLLWALVFASFLAFILLEGTARLTIVSGMSLGQCLQRKYVNSPKIYETAVICWVVIASILIGNTFFEMNNFAGGIDAVMSVPGASELTGSASVGLRVGACLAYAVIVLVLLYIDKTDSLGIFLGMIMMGMVALFLTVVTYMDINWSKFGWGLIPNLPAKTATSAEPADLIISLVGTTAVGYNLFLGGSMAKGKELGSAQRGIAFSSISSLMVSGLILIVGSGAFEDGSSSKFSISVLGRFIKQFVGEAGVVVFAVGFMAAALSSQITCPLAAFLTIDSVFSEKKLETNEEDTEQQSKFITEESKENPKAETKKPNRLVFFGTIMFMVLVSIIVVCADVDRTYIILVAQVLNGCLLPFHSICLVLCINDREIMSSSPQSGVANFFMLISVTITFFLANNVMVGKIFGSMLSVAARVGIAVGLASIEMVAIIVFTNLKTEIMLSIRSSCEKIRNIRK